MSLSFATSPPSRKILASDSLYQLPENEDTCVLNDAVGHPELGLYENIANKSSSSRMQVFSFFSGAGFLDLGFEMSSFRISYVNEINTEFIEGYSHSREGLGLEPPEFGISSGSVENYLSITKKRLAGFVKAAKQNAIVGFVGGPPCPDFSVGGKNRGHEGDNGRLTDVYFEMIKEHKPDWFLFENVKGLWSTARHKEFYSKMMRRIVSAGYSVTDRLINAIEFGVPQDRQRVICVGFAAHLAEKLGINKSGQLPDGLFPWQRYAKFDWPTLLNLPWPKTNDFGAKISPPENIPVELMVQHWFDRNRVDHHPNAIHQFKPRAGLAKFESVLEGDDSRKSYKRLRRYRYSPTACYGNNEVHLHPTLARRISVAEAMAIQSLPPLFTLPDNMSLSAMFKTVGNGVPYLAARGIAQSLNDFITPAIL